MDRYVVVEPAQGGQVFRVVGATVGAQHDVVGLEAVAAGAPRNRAAAVAGCDETPDCGRDRPCGGGGDAGLHTGDSPRGLVEVRLHHREALLEGLLFVTARHSALLGSEALHPRKIHSLGCVESGLVCSGVSEAHQPGGTIERHETLGEAISCVKSGRVADLVFPTR